MILLIHADLVSVADSFLQSRYDCKARPKRYIFDQSLSYGSFAAETQLAVVHGNITFAEDV